MILFLLGITMLLNLKAWMYGESSCFGLLMLKLMIAYKFAVEQLLFTNINFFIGRFSTRQTIVSHGTFIFLLEIVV